MVISDQADGIKDYGKERKSKKIAKIIANFSFMPY